MGLKVSATEAARLSERAVRTIRRWIETGRLAAEAAGLREPGPGVGPSQWLVDVDDLARIPGVVLDRAYLAELEQRSGTSDLLAQIIERLRQVEASLGELRSRVEHLEAGGSGQPPTSG